MTGWTALAFFGIVVGLLTGACAQYDIPAALPDERRIPVELRNFEFQPEAIVIAKGELIGFELTSADIRHTFTITGTNVEVHVQPGRTLVEQVRFNKTGNFAIICTITGHAKAGMVGTLVVR